ncbi:Lipoprotein associated domain [Mycoplasmopsis californica]|nr:Lipoprotein associated domain [Mycoplasmopsis californica]
MNNKHNQDNQNIDVTSNVPQIQPTTYLQPYKTQAAPYQQSIQKQPSMTKRIISSVIAVGVPVAITAGVVIAFLNLNKQSNDDQLQKMKLIVKNLSLNVDKKAEKEALKVRDKDLQLIGVVPNEYSVSSHIHNLDAKNGSIQATITLIAKNGTSVDSSPITIEGFKKLDANDLDALSVASAVATLRGNLQAIKALNDDKLIFTKNKGHLVPSEYMYTGDYDLEADTGLPIKEIANGINFSITQTPYFNFATNDTDQLKITATISRGKHASHVEFLISGFMSQTKKDLAELDKIFENFGNSYSTLNYSTKTAEAVMQNEYLEVNEIFRDIAYDIKSIKEKYPSIVLSEPRHEISGDTGLSIEIDAKLNKAVKTLKFKVNGFSSLSNYNQSELAEFMKNFNSPVATREHTNKLSSEYNYRDYLDLFSDLDWHFDQEAKAKGITITLGNSTNQDGVKLVTIILTKNSAQLTKQIKITNFKTNAEYADYIFKQFFDQVPNILYTNNHSDKVPSAVNYDIVSLDEDTKSNLRSLAARFNITLGVKAQNNEGVFAQNGSKQVTLEAKIAGQVKTKNVIVEGFLTANESHKQTLPKIVAEIGNKNQTTKNHTDKGTNDPLSAYDNFEAFANDVQINFANIKNKYPGVSFESFYTVSNDDGSRTVSFNVKLGNESANIIITIEGFKTNQVVINETVKKIKLAINEEYTTTKYANKLPSEASDLYTDTAEIDADLSTNLEQLATANGALITIKNKKANDEAGTMIISLDIVLDTQHYDEFFVAKGFTTPSARANAQLDAVINQLQTTYPTQTHQNEIPSAVDYATVNELATDLGINLSTLTPKVNIDFDKTRKAQDDDAKATKKVFLTLSINGYERSHAITITGFTTSRETEVKRINDFVNNFNKDYTTLLNNTKHASEVAYLSKEELKDDTNCDLSAQETTNNVLINLISQTTNGDVKEVNLEVKSKQDSTIKATLKINVRGFITSTQFEERVLFEYVNNFITNNQFSTINNSKAFPIDVSYNDVNKIINDGAKKLEVKAQEITTKYKINNNNRALRLELNNAVNVINDDDNGTKTISLKAIYGNTTKVFNVIMTGFYSKKSKQYLEGKINEFINNKLDVKLINNGEMIEGAYRAKLPSQVPNGDILFTTKNGSAIDNKFQVSIARKVANDTNHLLDVYYKVTYTENGNSLTSEEKLKQFPTSDIKPIVDKLFDASDFGYFKTRRALKAKLISKGNESYKLDAYNKKFKSSVNFKIGEGNNFEVNYITKPSFPKGTENIKVKYEIAKYEIRKVRVDQVKFDNIFLYFNESQNRITFSGRQTMKLYPHELKTCFSHITNRIDPAVLHYSYDYDGTECEKIRAWINIKYTYMNQTVYKSIFSFANVIRIVNEPAYKINSIPSGSLAGEYYVYMDYYFDLSKERAKIRQDGKAN